MWPLHAVRRRRCHGDCGTRRRLRRCYQLLRRLLLPDVRVRWLLRHLVRFLRRRCCANLYSDVGADAGTEHIGRADDDRHYDVCAARGYGRSRRERCAPRWRDRVRQRNCHRELPSHCHHRSGRYRAERRSTHEVVFRRRVCTAHADGPDSHQRNRRHDRVCASLLRLLGSGSLLDRRLCVPCEVYDQRYGRMGRNGIARIPQSLCARSSPPFPRSHRTVPA